MGSGGAAELLLRIAAHTRVGAEDYVQAPVRQVRVPGVATVKRALQQALQSAGSTTPGLSASAMGGVKAKLVLAPGLEPVSIIDGLPLDLQLDAAASSQNVDVHRLPRPPLLNVYVDAVIDPAANADIPTRKRARTSPHIQHQVQEPSPNPAPPHPMNMNGTTRSTAHAPLATFAARAAARGRGARNPVARSRRRSHMQACAAIAADAERSQRTRRKRPSEHVTPAGGGAPAHAKGSSSGGTNGRIVPEPLVFETLPDSCADTYIVMSLIEPYYLSARESTLFCALCGTLATEQCAMVLPAAEAPLRNLFADAAIVLASSSDLSHSLPKPIIELITSNCDSDNSICASELLSKPKMLSRFKAAAKRLVDHPFLASSEGNDQIHQFPPGQANQNQPAPDPGNHWKRSQTRKLLTSLIQIVPDFIPPDPSHNHLSPPTAAAVAN